MTHCKARSHRPSRLHPFQRRIALEPLGEDLEIRRMLSAQIAPMTVLPAIAMTPPVSGPVGAIYPLNSSSPQGLAPSQVVTAYGAGAITFNSADGSPITGDGTGQTIAIVDAYDAPSFVDSTSPSFAASDLAKFDARFGLPNPPSFKKVNQSGGTTLPGTDPSGAGNDDWEIEEALDVEWAHAMAPGASIILVECNSSNGSDMYAGVSEAASLPGVSVISMSWGGPEYNTETQDDATFTTPTGHQGVTFVAATGDSGYPGSYPAYSPNVLAVGGTSLYLNNNGTYNHESGWSGSGGGSSQHETEPSYQDDVQSTGNRTNPDVSIVADPSTGVAIYDSYDFGNSDPWLQVGGTSLATPLWAALIAIADQGRVLAGATTLDGPSQTLPYLYALPSSDFHDITTGSNNGESAGIGYDEVTGIGTPIANQLVPDLAYWDLPNQLVITTEPASSVAAGAGILLTVKVETPSGIVVTSASGNVSLGIVTNPGATTLLGTTTAILENGVATFTADQIDIAADGYTLRASDPGYASQLTTAFNITPGPASKLVISAEPPSSVAAGSNFGLTIKVEDAYDNLVTSDTSSVTIGIATGPSDSTLQGTDTVAVTAGYATFTALRLTTAATGYSLIASDSSLATAASSIFTITALSAASLAIQSEPPSTITAGQNFGLTVKVVDIYGNTVANDSTTVMVSIVSGTGPASGTLGGTVSEASSNSGLAVFSALQLTIAGAGYELRATAGSLSSSPTQTIAVNPAAAFQLVMNAQPPWTVTAGAPFALTVALDDRYGNLATSDDSTVSLSVIGPNNAALASPASETPTSGLAAFSNLRIDQAGAGDSIYATDGSVGSIFSITFAVQAAAPASLAITSGPAGSISAGSTFAVQLAVEDAYGNPTTETSGSVNLSILSGPNSETLNGVSTATITNGTARFDNLSLDTATAAITLDATSTDLTSVTIPAFAITPAAPAKLAFLTNPAATISAGANIALAVQIEDTYGNPETSSLDSIRLDLAGAPAGTILHGAASAPATAGTATFTGLNVQTAGTGYTVTATDGALASATTSTFAVVPAAPAQLVVVAQPQTTITAGVPFSVDFAVADLYGNTITTASNDVSLTLLNAPVNPGFTGSTQTVISNGTALFSALTLTTATPALEFEASTFGLSTATTQPISVQAAPASQFVIAGPPPTTVSAGIQFSILLRAQDAYGNVATSDNQPVSVSLTASNDAALIGPTSASLSNGVLSYNLTLDKSGQANILSFTTPGLPSVSTSAITVVAAAPARVAILTEPPATIVAGTPFALTVAIEDTFGNIVASDTGSVALSIFSNPAAAMLTGPTTVSATDGVATFSSLVLTTAGPAYTFTATAPGLTTAQTTALAVTHGPASELHTSSAPAVVTANRGFVIIVVIEDEYGNLDTSYTGPLTAALSMSPAHAKLTGTLTAAPSAGIVDFNNLIIRKPGKTYEVRFTAPGLRPLITSPFKVAKTSSHAAAKARTGHAVRPLLETKLPTLRSGSIQIRPATV